MQTYVGLALLFMACGATAVAQQSNGYIYAAPGAVTVSGSSSKTLHVGGGGEVAIGKGFAVGAELGVVAPPEHFDEALGVFSPGASYHFVRNPRAKVDPFIGGGYTLMFRSGHSSLGYFGGGVNYWFHRKMALRAEFRDHLRSDYGRTIHFWGVRMGFTFR